MDNMFDGCELLKIIDFQNLDVTSVKNIESVNNIFINCKNLEYINLKNLKSNIKLTNQYFNGIQKNSIFCIDSNKMELINNAFNENNCFLINCDINFLEYKYKYKTDSISGCIIQNCSISKYIIIYKFFYFNLFFNNKINKKLL